MVGDRLALERAELLVDALELQQQADRLEAERHAGIGRAAGPGERQAERGLDLEPELARDVVQRPSSRTLRRSSRGKTWHLQRSIARIGKVRLRFPADSGKMAPEEDRRRHAEAAAVLLAMAEAVEASDKERAAGYRESAAGILWLSTAKLRLEIEPRAPLIFKEPAVPPQRAAG